MTDSTDNNTNELDSYGVWVKRPSKAPSDETPVNNDAESFNLDADLPDFSEIDISSVASDISSDTEDKLQDDTTLSTEELSDITDAINTPEEPETSAEGGLPEKIDEVSLEDFLDEGFSDPGAKPAAAQDSPEKDEAPAAAGESEDISLDDFLDSDFSADEPEKDDKAPDETPLDIDLSFSSDEPAAETAESVLNETESVDASDFITPSEEEKTSEDSDTTGSDAFDDMFSSITDTGTTPDTEPSSEEPEHDSDSSSSMETENIDLSDFGIDAEAEETPITTNIAENKPKSAAVDYELAVTEDDSTAQAPVVNEIKSAAGSAVPDTFDEETNSLISAPSEKADTTTVNNTLLQQIVADLSGLKNEISSLKNDFAELKAHEEQVAAGTSDKQPAKGGFFAEQDEDDTISLSGDELDNIMNTTDFSGDGKEAASSQTAPASEETAEQYEEIPSIPDETEPSPREAPVSEPAQELTDENLFGTIDSSVQVPETPAVDDTTSSDLTMNFDNEKLEEPDLDDLSSDTSSETLPGELPEEISIPKVDDILVESSSTDFMDSVKDTTEGSGAEEEPVDLSAAPAESSDAESSDAEPKADDASAEDIFPQEPSVADSLTKDNIDYLSTDESAEKEEETGTPEEETAPAAEKTQSLPGDLTQEVKSVLLYMDQLLENLPEDKIIEFARSEHFATYKKLFSDLGLS
ncbi:MAG TPA: hypothetical protein DCL73_16580 [Treponema sp.]|nr:hypothetical protein [Treponema sp.]